MKVSLNFLVIKRKSSKKSLNSLVFSIFYEVSIFSPKKNKVTIFLFGKNL